MTPSQEKHEHNRFVIITILGAVILSLLAYMWDVLDPIDLVVAIIVAFLVPIFLWAIQAELASQRIGWSKNNDTE